MHFISFHVFAMAPLALHLMLFFISTIVCIQHISFFRIVVGYLVCSMLVVFFYLNLCSICKYVGKYTCIYIKNYSLRLLIIFASSF